MTYLIHPIKFEGDQPDIENVVARIESLTNQKVKLKSEFRCQYKLSFDFEPEDELNVNISANGFTMSGNVGVNPAMHQICRSVLIDLGGKDSSEYPLIKIPTTESEILQYNKAKRLSYAKSFRVIYIYIFGFLALIMLLIYFVIKMVL